MASSVGSSGETGSPCRDLEHLAARVVPRSGLSRQADRDQRPTPHLPFPNGVYGCNDRLFDIDFSDAIQREIFLGVYERHERAFLRGYVRRGWTCVDIGANVGFYTSLFAQLTGPRGKVVCVEAFPGNVTPLARNIELNGVADVTVVRAAVTDRDGPVQFHAGPSHNPGWGRIVAWKGSQDIVTVDGLSFDTLLATQHLETVDFMKIDIEGYELSFMKGGSSALAYGIVKRLLAEYCGYSLEPMGVTLQDYVRAFEDLGIGPVRWCLDAITAARASRYAARGEILNLLFEHRALHA